MEVTAMADANMTLIQIPQPAMALNAGDSPGDDKIQPYTMQFNREVEDTDSPTSVLKEVANVAKTLAGGKLKVLVINCHGLEKQDKDGTWHGGYGLQLGTQIHLVHVQVFHVLKDRVEIIVIAACGAADVSVTGHKEGNGKFFCQRIAKLTGAKVIAANEGQKTGGTFFQKGIPDGLIDGFEGDVFAFGPSGSDSDVKPWKPGKAAGIHQYPNRTSRYANE
jgi:hypothetical protein